MRQNKKSLRQLAGFLTKLREDLMVLGLEISYRFRFCKATENTSEHPQTNCDALVRKRMTCVHPTTQCEKYPFIYLIYSSKFRAKCSHSLKFLAIVIPGALAPTWTKPLPPQRGAVNKL